MSYCNELHNIEPLINIIDNSLSHAIGNSSEHIFSGAISKSDFIAHLTFEYYERTQMIVSPKKTLRQQFEARDNDEYEKAYKTYPKLIKAGGKHLKRLGLPDKRDPELLLDLSENKITRLNGRPMSVLYKKTIENYSRNTSTRPIVPLFYQGLINTAKRCSNSRVNEAYHDYYLELQSYAASDSDWLFNAIDIFQMEENMHISLVYQLAHYMADHSITEFTPQRLQIFGLIPHETGRLLQNNMVCFKSKLFPALFADEATYQDEYSCISAMLEIRGRLMPLLLLNQNLKNFMLDAKSEHPLITFFKNNYNLFDLIDFPESGKLDPAVIKLMRDISSEFLAT